MSKIIVDLPIEWASSRIYRIKGTYKLLIDTDSNFIKDWYAQFEEFSINSSTTSSHEYLKQNNKNLRFRKKLLELLSVPHSFGGINNRCIKHFTLQENSDEINIINNFFKNEYNNTFQNIEYLISGNNPSGRGSIVTTIDDKKVKLSFFFQFRNNIDYEDSSSWRNRLDFRGLWQYNTIPFENWISNYYINFTENRKTIKQTIFDINSLPFDSFKELINSKNEQINELEKQRQLENLIDSKRNSIKRQFSSTESKVAFCESRWRNRHNTNSSSELQVAHIWPVSQIIKQCINENYNFDILNQVDDEYNILLLPPNQHRGFDRYKFYWEDSDGRIRFIDSQYPNNNHEIFYYQQIDLQSNPQIRPYLKKYKDYLRFENIISIQKMAN